MGRLLAQQLDRLDSLTSLLRRRVLPLMRVVKTLHLLRRELGPLERSLEQLLHAVLELTQARVRLLILRIQMKDHAAQRGGELRLILHDR